MLPPTPWSFSSDSYVGEVVLRDSTGKPFLAIPAEAEMVEAKHAVGLVKRRWRMEQAEALARLLTAAPAMWAILKELRAELADYDEDGNALYPERLLDILDDRLKAVLPSLDFSK